MSTISTIALVLYYILSVMDFCFLILAICSWIPAARGTRIYEFFYNLTEPILRPVRELFMRWEFARRCPIDLSFLAVILLISFMQRLIIFLI